jgi:RNA polymerase sigma factor (sigma-70 family)
MMDDDITLLREFAARQSEPAFAALVDRYIGLVYSAALRQTGDTPLAEEITQAVLIILARKAASLGADTILPAWLYRTTRYAAADAVKSQRRRQTREHEAYMQSKLQSDDSVQVWLQLAPVLDEAMANLSEQDRAPLLLRYFENRPWREIAALTHVSEDAAQKRVERALEKLRVIFANRGIKFTAALIADAVAGNSVQAAPAGLAKAATVAGVAKGSAATASTLALVKAATPETAKLTGLKTATAGAMLANLAVPQPLIASHFNFAGRPDAWMTPADFWASAIFIEIAFPLFFVVVGYAVRLLPVNQFTFKNIPNREYWLEPDHREEMFDCVFRNYLWMACFAAIFMLILHLLVLFANQQDPPQFPTFTALGLGASFIVAVVFRIGVMMRFLKRI